MWMSSQGTKIRVDAIGTDKPTGNIVIQEYKSSETASLTKNQIKGFPELQIGGGSVVGKGKGIFKGSTPIPRPPWACRGVPDYSYFVY